MCESVRLQNGSNDTVTTWVIIEHPALSRASHPLAKDVRKTEYAHALLGPDLDLKRMVQGPCRCKCHCYLDEGAAVIFTPCALASKREKNNFIS